ncbi:MAG TPA: ABC transporter ATP-binding protein [Syntrophobacter fumaroxidans]|nr:ABC transporter ATP-binding protein [Syntrophobacter fumaroxidans]
MSDVVISVEGLGKKYRIRHAQVGRYRTFREALAQGAGRPFRALRRALGAGLSGGETPAGGGERSSSEDFWALEDVCFEVRRGDVVGIIGRNGAGKSTLLKILSRITEPTAGRVRLRGRVGSLLEVGTGFHPELSGRENIFMNGAILGMTRAEITRKFDEIVAFAEIEKFLDTPVKRYSSGMYVRLAFAVAAHLDPEILLVDEVLAVGDVQFQQKCLGKMSEVSRGGRTVLFVSHNMAAVNALCARGILLSRGRVAEDGPVSGVVAAYLADSVKDRVNLETGPLKWVAARQTMTGLEISAEYAFDRPVSLPCLGFVISDHYGNPIFGCNPKMSAIHCLENPVSAGSVTASIRSPELRNGTYRMSIWFGDGKVNSVVIRDCLTFDVTNLAETGNHSAAVNGPVIARCEWDFSR